MCWNASVSINTFLLGLFAVGMGIYNNILPLSTGIFYMSFISMQLIEYFTWENLNHKRTIEILSHLALFIVLSQPIFSFISSINTPIQPYIGIYIGLYIILALIIIWYIYKNNEFSMIRSSNGHLAWKWLDIPSWMVYSWVFFIVIPYLYTKQYYTGFIILFIFGITYYLYSESLTWGSLWCWITAFISIKLLYDIFYRDFCYISKK